MYGMQIWWSWCEAVQGSQCCSHWQIHERWLKQGSASLSSVWEYWNHCSCFGHPSWQNSPSSGCLNNSDEAWLCSPCKYTQNTFSMFLYSVPIYCETNEIPFLKCHKLAPWGMDLGWCMQRCCSGEGHPRTGYLVLIPGTWTLQCWYLLLLLSSHPGHHQLSEALNDLANPFSSLPQDTVGIYSHYCKSQNIAQDDQQHRCQELGTYNI